MILTMYKISVADLTPASDKRTGTYFGLYDHDHHAPNLYRSQDTITLKVCYRFHVKLTFQSICRSTVEGTSAKGKHSLLLSE